MILPDNQKNKVYLDYNGDIEVYYKILEEITNDNEKQDTIVEDLDTYLRDNINIDLSVLSVCYKGMIVFEPANGQFVLSIRLPSDHRLNESLTESNIYDKNKYDEIFEKLDMFFKSKNLFSEYVITDDIKNNI
jgi:hypothetical protein